MENSTGTRPARNSAAPGFALIQNQTPTEMRSVAAAINLFIVNIIELGLGPFSIGFFSDMCSPEYGLDGLRYAFMSSLVVSLWGHSTTIGRVCY